VRPHFGEENAMPASIFDTMKAPPTAQLELDVEKKSIKVGFDGKADFLNPAGNIQGGILSAMFDDAMGPIVVAATGGAAFPTTIDLHVHFIRPVKPGAISVTAEITNIGKQLVFLEGRLFDSAGKLCARATAAALLSALDGIRKSR
jgi:uncharacterized protein (TIGR00369 family)